MKREANLFGSTVLEKEVRKKQLWVNWRLPVLDTAAMNCFLDGSIQYFKLKSALRSQF